MNKAEFVGRMAEKGGITKKQASMEADLFIETLMDCLGEGGAVKLHGFGRFEVKTAKERIGRNPKTGEEFVIPEHRKVKFHASEGLADRMREKQ